MKKEAMSEGQSLGLEEQLRSLRRKGVWHLCALVIYRLCSEGYRHSIRKWR